MLLSKNTSPLFLRPFKMLEKVVFKYKNGQMKHSVFTKSPASVFEKRNVPIRSPNRKKTAVQLTPREIQNQVPCLKVLLIAFTLFAAA